MKQKRKSDVAVLLDYAGSHKRLTFLGLALSAVSMLLSMAPYICIWLAARDLIAVAPDWTEAQSVRFDRALKILSKEFFLSEERIMAIIRERSKVDPDIHPVPKVRAPRLTFKQLSLFTDDAGYPIAQIHRDS